MDKKAKIYIAGHRGMVGFALKRGLQVKGYENIITATHSELDLSRQNEVESFFENEKPEYVFMAAAKVGGILANNTYKAEFIYDNIMIAANIINSAHKYGVKKLLNLGSSCIYPKFAEQPIKEEYLLTDTLEPTNEPYAIAKIAALKLCRYYNEQYGTDFISVMPTNLYGLYDNYNLETSHVMPALIRKFHLAKLLSDKNFIAIRKDFNIYPLGFDLGLSESLDDETSIKNVLERSGITENNVTLWGTGEVFREFLYVDDLADASIFLMEKYGYDELGEIINIGTGEDVTINELAEIIKNIVGYEGEIKNDVSRPDGPPKKLLNVNRIKKMGWEAKIELAEGIAKTYHWYCENEQTYKI
ncbi:GDP-L-fucose synthase [bacterium BMS3Bbin09]|nr:GDP-L-fucose synthase [bacterium BMS3Bbin09]